MSWIWLLLAGLMEICWAIGLKYTDSFTKFWPSVFTASLMLFSFYLLSLALETIPLGTAYAIWTGIGATGVVLVGILFFNEPYSMARLFYIFLILIGIIGLKFSSV